MESVILDTEQLTWHPVCHVTDVPPDGGACVLLHGRQIAIFHYARRGEWYATDNQCPHRGQMALSRGLIGRQGDEPKVACPFHKKTFSLRSGQCLGDDAYRIDIFDIKVENNLVYIRIPTE